MSEQRLDHLEKMLAQILEEVEKIAGGIEQLEEVINNNHQESMALIDVLSMRTTRQEAALAQLKGKPKVKP